MRQFRFVLMLSGLKTRLLQLAVGLSDVCLGVL